MYIEILLSTTLKFVNFSSWGLRIAPYDLGASPYVWGTAWWRHHAVGLGPLAKWLVGAPKA